MSHGNDFSNSLITFQSLYKIFVFFDYKLFGAICGLSGLKVALGIQKQITAKREQVDLLQSRVQMLEESTEKLTQV